MDYVPLPRTGRLWKSKADFFRSFRSAAVEAGENIIPLFDPSLVHHEENEPDLKKLNSALAALVDIFPDIEPEVFREMLLSLSEESRLQVVTEQLLKKKATWVRGRYRATAKPQDTVRDMPKAVTKRHQVGEQVLSVEDTFRGEAYITSARQILYQEFKNLSHSAIKGVMAEHNHSYTMSRPTLHQLSAKSWRFSISSLWLKRSPSSTLSDHPAIIWQTEGTQTGERTPAIKRTGSHVLDSELYHLLVEPVVSEQQRIALSRSRALAHRLNEAEAEEAEATFDCECCYSPIPFEQLATCDTACHYLCFDCVRRTTNEALYGQGWARSVDVERSTIRCFAPALQECQGCVPADLARRALEEDEASPAMWAELQKRTAREALIKSRVPLQRCPSCEYAEVDETPIPRLRTAKGGLHHLIARSSAGLQLAILLTFIASLFLTAPALLLAGCAWVAISLFPPIARLVDASWTRVYQKRRGLKFRCRNDLCRKVSCMRCTAIWRDPHICFEHETTSLRTAIESSATAAIKRTCPKCMLSFVKSSGCNKLVCNCGYTMCYVCRSEINSREGYGHFCQHFRPHGGRCTECERCDLYGDEDEAAAIKKAAGAAEKAWRDKESAGSLDTLATQLMVETLVGHRRHGRWYEDWLDALADALVA